jgi:type VI secretion system protein ImpF
VDLYSPSLLDKLFDDAPSGRDGAATRHTVDQIKDSVARDIEMLLNAHPVYEPSELAHAPLSAQSLLTLGLVDISSMSLASDNDRRRINEAIRRTLATHERRLSDVEVKVRGGLGPRANLTFLIRAKLVLHPHAEPVLFDAVLQPGSKRYQVSQADPRAPLDPE